MYIEGIRLFAKNKKRIDSDTKDTNIHPGYRNKFGREKCAMLIVGTSQITEGIDLLNQE